MPMLWFTGAMAQMRYHRWAIQNVAHGWEVMLWLRPRKELSGSEDSSACSVSAVILSPATAPISQLIRQGSAEAASVERTQ